jgi:alkylated DNA repair dioxygenase AlkB
MVARQPDFFAAAALPAGFRYHEDFLARSEEAALLTAIGRLPFAHARYKAWTANRRVVSYGGRYDFSLGELLPEAPVPPFLRELRSAVARFADIDGERLTHTLVAEYAAGTQLGWHRDVPEFELVVGVSLLGPARLRLRPYPHQPGSGRRPLGIELAPRSIYALRDEARWGWQHAISPTPGLRYSITFRTLRRDAG